jgi:anti-anti-sigma regulatory factor
MARSCEEFGDRAGLTVRTVLVVADDRHANIQFRGELDLANADPFADVLEGAPAAGRRFVRLDLAGLGFVGSSRINGAPLRAL